VIRGVEALQAASALRPGRFPDGRAGAAAWLEEGQSRSRRRTSPSLCWPKRYAGALPERLDRQQPTSTKSSRAPGRATRSAATRDYGSALRRALPTAATPAIPRPSRTRVVGSGTLCTVQVQDGRFAVLTPMSPTPPRQVEPPFVPP